MTDARNEILTILCRNRGHAQTTCKPCERLTDKILARYDIDGLLEDLSVLNAENHRLLDLVDAALPKHNDAYAPHSPGSSMRCLGCAARGVFS